MRSVIIQIQNFGWLTLSHTEKFVISLSIFGVFITFWKVSEEGEEERFHQKCKSQKKFTSLVNHISCICTSGISSINLDFGFLTYSPN